MDEWGKGSKIPSSSVSLYYCNLLNALTEEHDVVLEETTAFFKHTRMKQSEERKLRCD